MLKKVLLELLRNDGVDDWSDFAVSEFGLGLSFVLWVWVFDRDDAGKTFAAVLGGEVVLFLLKEFELSGVVVDDFA